MTTEVPEWEKFSKMFNWIARSKRLSAFEKLLYTRIHGHLGEHTEAWPGMRALASELGASKSQVAKGLKRLEKLKLIAVFRTSKVGPKRGVNYYSFTDPPMRYETPEESAAYVEVSPGQVRRVPPAGPHVSSRQDNHVPPAGTEETHLRDSGEETQEETQFAGSLRSPEAVSLRSSANISANLTPNPSPTSQTLSQATTVSAAPNPPQPSPAGQAPHQEAARRLAGELLALAGLPEPRQEPVGVLEVATPESTPTLSRASCDAVPEPLVFELPEEDMPDPKRMAAAMAALAHGASVGEAEILKKRAKQINRARQAAKPETPPGELPKVKPPKQTLVGVLLGLQNTWLGEFKRKFPTAPVATHWGPKEAAQFRHLLQLYDGTSVAIEVAIKYYIRHWEVHREKIWKGKALFPNVDQFCRLHASLIPEAGEMSMALKAKQDYDDWCKSHPNAFSAPDDLRASYEAARPALKTFGF